MSMSDYDTYTCSGQLGKDTAQIVLKLTFFHPIGTAFHLLDAICIQCAFGINIHSIKRSPPVIKHTIRSHKQHWKYHATDFFRHSNKQFF